MGITIEMLMEQAQAFASAFAEVDGTFSYQGEKFDKSQQEKARLEEMLEEFQEEIDTNAAAGNLKEIAEGLIEWHQNRIQVISTMLEAEEGTKLCIGKDDAKPIDLKGDYFRGFRTALIIAKAQFEPFPLSIDRTAPASDEEE